MTTNNTQLIIHERGSVFSGIYDCSNWQYCELGTRRLFPIFGILPSANFRVRFIGNSRYFDCLFCTSVNKVATISVSTNLFLVLSMTNKCTKTTSKQAKIFWILWKVLKGLKKGSFPNKLIFSLYLMSLKTKKLRKSTIFQNLLCRSFILFYSTV